MQCLCHDVKNAIDRQPIRVSNYKPELVFNCTMGTLYEYLREARLEQFYPAFRANGITRSEALINLGMPEFFALGITSSEDKRRLVELVNIIKSVHDSSYSNTYNSQRRNAGQRQHNVANLNYGNSALEGSPSLSRKVYITRNQNSPSNRANVSRETAAPVAQHLEPARDVVVQDRVSNFSLASYVSLLRQLSESSGSDAALDYSDDERTVSHRNISSPTPVRVPISKGPAVERIKHSKRNSYNYGVHKVQTPAKSRASKSSSNKCFGDEKIKVCVRKRPLTKREQRTKDEDIVHTESTNTLIVNESKLAVDLKAYTLQHEFVFDEVFDEKCTNEDVYIRAARPLISCIFNGGIATCFAYGQTGAGKTHTMLGGENVPGLYLLAGQDIFSIIQSGTRGKDLHVWVSFFEIYCGQLFDLLNRRNRLHAREDGSRQVCIAGLTETEATSVNSMVQILQYGNSVRSKGASGVNPDSSRSHAILQLDIRNRDDVKIGKISFIDLAGSERASDVTDTDKQTRMEGAEINQSLLALKECIRSIDQDSRHTPFRQSKLTHILKDSFVGNSRTCMIANISPTQTACENTLNTLRYADRVKELKRDSTRGSSVGQAMNLLMNIPPIAPTIFHPSNVFTSSTPMKSSSHSQRERASILVDSFLDPSETPITGHNLRRKQRESTRNKQDQSYTQSTALHSRIEQLNVVSSHSQVPPGLISRSSTHATAASNGASAPPPDASPSESDQTDTDSCNVTSPYVHKSENLTRQIQGQKSTDSEHDFPTSDFNNIDDINDLNRKSAVQKDQRKYKQKESHFSNQISPDDQAVSAASGVEIPAVSVVSSGIRAPKLRPVMYRSTDPEAEVANVEHLPQTSKSSHVGHQFQTVAEQIPPHLSVPSSRLKNTHTNEVNTSNDTISDEELFFDLAETHNALQEMNNLDAPLSSSAQAVLKSNPVPFMNKDLMIPLPGNSGDLAYFTQRSSLRQAVSLNAGATNIFSSKSAKDNTALNVEKTLAQLEDLTPKVSSHSRPRSPLKMSVSPSSKQLQHKEGKTFLKENDAISSSAQLQQPLSRQFPQGSRHSPEQLNTASAFTAPLRAASPNKSSEDSLHGLNVQCLSDISDPGSHVKASPSPTGDCSGDSLDSVRASLSDQGQGGHQSHKSRSSLRKGTSDPMLALNTQRKKHTLPDPQSFSKMLTRSKQGRIHKDAGWKVIHNELPLSNAPEIVSTMGDSHSDHGHMVTCYDDHQKGNMLAHRDNIKLNSGYVTISASDLTRPSTTERSINIQQRPDTSNSKSDIHVFIGHIQGTAEASSIGVKYPGKKNSVVMTEKLSAGCVFSPIHPPPMSTAGEKLSDEPTSSSSILFQPTPISASYLPNVESGETSTGQDTTTAPCEEAKLQLISAHEDQLATITSLCKYEMRLLLSAKKFNGKKGFDDYLRRVDDILQQKMAAIRSLHELICEYRASHSQCNSVVSLIAASTSDLNTSLSSNIPTAQK